VIESFMLTKFGIVMVALWLLDTASHRPAGSWIHLLSILACISFVAEFVRSRTLTFWNSRDHEQSEAVSAIDKFRARLLRTPAGQ
jgi:hypothetical protein